MKILQFDSVGGASGDMILGALIDLGVEMSEIDNALRSLTVENIHLQVDPAESHGLHGTRVKVHVDGHDAEHHHNDQPGHDRVHRGLADIAKIVTSAPLPDEVKDQSMQVFRCLAKAESHVHRVDVENIHFHEVGALDSIADIVGGCVAVFSLDVDQVVVGPLPIGRGTVRCAHGEYPVPAPATLLVLKDYPLVQTDEPYELVTPTGAALLTTWKTHHAPPPGSRVTKVGYGFGHRMLDRRPNVLRTTLLETDMGWESDSCFVVECNVDDTNPELIGVLAEALLSAGALDVFTSSVQMKKQRPGILVTVLCRPDQHESMLDLLFRESTTFGVRTYSVQRTLLPRDIETVSTEYGEVRVKVGCWQGDEVTRSPEMDDCLARAKEHGVSVRAVYDAALRNS